MNVPTSLVYIMETKILVYYRYSNTKIHILVFSLVIFVKIEINFYLFNYLTNRINVIKPMSYVEILFQCICREKNHWLTGIHKVKGIK